MSQTWMQTNRPALARHPQLAVLVDRLPAGDPAVQYQVMPAKDGSPTLIVTGPEGKPFTYHSRYDPISEARRQVEGVDAGQSHVLLFGLGLGYVLDQLLSRSTGPLAKGKVIVIEPDPQVFRHALASRDFRLALADPRITWCIGQTADQVGDVWASVLDWTAFEKLAILEHIPSMGRFPEFFARLKEKIRFLSNRSKGNLVTLMRVGHQFHSNGFHNISAIATLPGVGRLFGRFRNVPAVVLAAGPSLEKNLHLLEEVQDRFLLIAVDTVFRPMVTQGLRPHIVCAGDPSYLNSLDFVGVEDVKDVWLALEPMTHPDIQRSFQGPKMLMSFGSGLASTFEPFREPVGTVVCWGSIATTAFDLAVQCGCDPIIFVGLDLSYQDGRLHIRGSYSDDVFYDKVHHFTSLEHETLDFIFRKGTRRITKTNGEVLYTDENMNLYRGWFEDRLQRCDRTVINATEGGVMTRHVKVLPLKETIKQYLEKGAPISQILSQTLSQPVRCRVDEIRKTLESLRRDLGKHETDSRRALQICRKMARRAEGLRVSGIDGPTRAEFVDQVQVHDRIGQPTPLTAWFNIHQAKFITRHAMELRRLRAERDPLWAEWLDLLVGFFEAVGRFHDYQMPLLDEAIRELEGIESRAAREESPVGEGRAGA